jgi:hypothetical protein
MLADFHINGSLPIDNDMLINFVSGLYMKEAIFFSIKMGIYHLDLGVY